MKKRIFIANVALLLVADIALTGYILNKRNKFNNEVDEFLYAHFQCVLICYFVVETVFSHFPSNEYNDEQCAYW